MKLSKFARRCGILFVVAVACPALAATITVTNINDDGAGSLRAAIAAASPGDTINFALTYPATITLSSTLTITQNLTIQGPGASNLSISGNRAVLVLSVSPGVTAVVSGLTIEWGDTFSSEGSSGAGINNAGSLALTNSTVSNNYAYVGGGIYNTGALTITSSTVSDNLATLGGGIWNSGTLTVNFSTVSNYADASGGGMVNNGGTVTISNSTFLGNAIDAFCAGGIWNEDGMVTVAGSTFSQNSSACGGGILNDGTLIVINSTFTGNRGQVGGGVLNNGTLTLTNSTFSDNGSADGGAIYNGGTLNIKNTILADNGGNCAGAVAISAGHNLSDDASCDFGGVGDLNSTPAGLDPAGLQNNGGSTQTIALLFTSPAVNAIPVSPLNYCSLSDGVTPVATDQRGMIRPQLQNCDIGAYEFATANSLIAAVESQISESMSGGNRTDRLELQQALAELSTALSTKNWNGSDGNHLNQSHAARFFLEEELAAGELTLVLVNKRSQIPIQQVQTDLNNLTFANRVLAAVAISDAAGKNPILLSWASSELAEGDQATAARDYNAAIGAYAAAWTFAESAM